MQFVEKSRLTPQLSLGDSLPQYRPGHLCFWAREETKQNKKSTFIQLLSCGITISNNTF